jgi:ribosome-binding protein aMBF1 (putative translation factor)
MLTGMSKSEATYKPAATSAIERASMPTVCECCGREQLKRTVKMVSVTGSVMWMGVGCAAKGSGVSVREINQAEREKQNEYDKAQDQAKAKVRIEEQARWQAHLDSRCPEFRGQVLRQIQALGGMATARVGFSFEK